MIRELQDLKTELNLFGGDYPTEPVSLVNSDFLRESLRALALNDNDLLSSFSSTVKPDPNTVVDSAQVLYALTKQIRELMLIALKCGVANSLSTSLADLHKSEMSRFWSIEQIERTNAGARRFEVKPKMYVVWDSKGRLINPPSFIHFNKRVCDDILFVEPLPEDSETYNDNEET